LPNFWQRRVDTHLIFMTGYSDYPIISENATTGSEAAGDHEAVPAKQLLSIVRECWTPKSQAAA